MTFAKKIEERFATSCFLLVVFMAATALSGFALAPKPFLHNPVIAAAPHAEQRASKKHAAAESSSDQPEKNAYDYSLPSADGKDIPLANFKGKYILIVNLGRKSTYNDQLPALIKFNDNYKDKGFVVIGVPSDDFGDAEPGTNAEIQKAYADANVDFLITSVCKLRGIEELPLYLYLTTGKGAPPGGPVHWNYTKFIIDKKGNVIARMKPDEAPDSPDMLSTISQILDGTFKPKKAEGKGDAGADRSDDDDDDD